MIASVTIVLLILISNVSVHLHTIIFIIFSTQKQKDDCLSERLEQVKNSMPTKAKGAVELVTEKGSSNWLTVIPLKELDYNLNKKEFRDAIKLLYD